MSGTRLIKQFGQTAIYSTLLVGSRALLLLLLARAFSPAEYGAYNLLVTLIGIGTYVLGFELYNYSYREAPGRDAHHGTTILVSLLLVELLLGGLLVALALGTGAYRPLLHALGLSTFHVAFHIAVVVLLLDVLATEMMRGLIARGEIGRANNVDLFKKALWIYPLVAATLIGWDVSVEIVLALMGAGAASSVIFGLHAVGWREMRRARPEWRHISRGVAFGSVLFLATLAEQGRLSADRFVLASVHGPAPVGAYALVLNLIGMCQMVTIGAVCTVLYPRAAAAYNAGDAPRARIWFGYMIKYGIASLVVALALLLLILDPLILLIGGSDYDTPKIVAVILAIATAAYNVGAVAHYKLLVSGRSNAVLIASVVGFVAAVAGALLLVPSTGMVGAATSLAIGHLVTAAAKISMSKIMRETDWRAVFSVTQEWDTLRDLWSRRSLRHLPRP